jgi:hypothetical protein
MEENHDDLHIKNHSLLYMSILVLFLVIAIISYFAWNKYKNSKTSVSPELVYENEEHLIEPQVGAPVGNVGEVETKNVSLESKNTNKDDKITNNDNKNEKQDHIKTFLDDNVKDLDIESYMNQRIEYLNNILKNENLQVSLDEKIVSGIKFLLQIEYANILNNFTCYLLKKTNLLTDELVMNLNSKLTNVTNIINKILKRVNITYDISSLKTIPSGGGDNMEKYKTEYYQIRFEILNCKTKNDIEKFKEKLDNNLKQLDDPKNKEQLMMHIKAINKLIYENKFTDKTNEAIEKMVSFYNLLLDHIEQKKPLPLIFEFKKQEMEKCINDNKIKELLSVS